MIRFVKAAEAAVVRAAMRWHGRSTFNRGYVLRVIGLDKACARLAALRSKKGKR